MFGYNDKRLKDGEKKIERSSKVNGREGETYWVGGSEALKCGKKKEKREKRQN